MEAGAIGHQVQFQHDFSADWSLLLGGGYRETDLEGYSTEAELAAGRQFLYVDGQTLSRQRRYRDYDANHTVVRGELSGRFDTGTVRHRTLVGADYDRFVNSQVFLRYRPPVVTTQTTQSGNQINIYNPIYGQFPLPTPTPQTDRVDESEAWGVYVQDQVQIAKQLQARAGARYDNFKTYGNNRATGARTSESDSKISPQVGLVFDATREVALYAVYGQGFRQNLGVDAAGNAFEPEETASSEAGVRLAVLDLQATVSLFSMTKSNILTADPANNGFSLALGEAQSRGVEFDLVGSLPSDIAMWLSYAFVDAKVTEDVRDVNFGQPVRTGDRLINVPEHTISLMASKGFLVARRKLTLGGGVLHVGERLGETATDFELPSYTTLRVFGSYVITKGMEAQAMVNNLTNETYYTNSFSRLWVAPGAPLNGSLTLRYRF